MFLSPLEGSWLFTFNNRNWTTDMFSCWGNFQKWHAHVTLGNHRLLEFVEVASSAQHWVRIHNYSFPAKQPVKSDIFSEACVPHPSLCSVFASAWCLGNCSFLSFLHGLGCIMWRKNKARAKKEKRHKSREDVAVYGLAWPAVGRCGLFTVCWQRI